jgi:Holliday junction resolvase RusA-like endonuclease
MNIIIDYEPTAKGMPRVKFLNGHTITYIPNKTKQAMESIYNIINNSCQVSFPPHTPLCLTVTFYRTKSKWLPKRETTPFRKSDLDNFIKCLLDSIPKSIVPDDAQYTSIIAHKRWSTNGHGFINLSIEEDIL